MTNASNNSRLKKGGVTTMKGSNDNTNDVAMGYNNHIKNNRYIPFKKIDSMNKEVAQSNLTEDRFNSLKGPSGFNRKVSHSKTLSEKEVQNNNKRVSICIVDANQSRLLRQLSLSTNLNHNNNKIQQNLSNTTRRTANFNSSIGDNNLTKGSILRLSVAKVESYEYDQESTQTFHSNERVITNNKGKHIVIKNEANIVSDYVNEIKIMHPHHLYNKKYN